jgi:hypothetical protein
MKNKAAHFCLTVCFLMVSALPDMYSQKFEIIPYAGYQTSAVIPSVNGDFRVNDGKNFGISLDIGSPDGGYKFYLSYSHQGSFLTLDSADIIRDVCDLAVHSISFGAMYEFFQGDMIVPFARLGLGTTIYQPVDSEIDYERVMHFNIAGGTKIFLNDHFGFRFQAGMVLPLFFEGFLFEEGAPPPGEGMKTKISGIYGDFTAGLIARF